MQDLEMKKGILKEIMDLMDQKEGDQLKSHPKFMAAKVEVAKPEESELLEDPKEEASESPEVEKSEDEISPEMIQKLMEHFKDLK